MFSEIFTDRGYTAAGNLVPRSEPGVLIHDGAFAAERLVSFLEDGMMPTVSDAPVALRAHSICVHGDSPDAVAMARTVRSALTRRGVEIAPFLPRV